MLEEIFTHLSGREQLNCRRVCHHWNELLCDRPRLLQDSVLLTIDINSSEMNLEELEILPIIKANTALKVKRLIVDCDIFLGENSIKPETVINFIKEHGITDMVEVFTFSVSEEINSAQILHDFLSALKKPKTLRLITNHLESKSEKYIKFEECWNSLTFPTIKNFKVETWGIDDNQLWTSTYSTFLMNVLQKMPNIKLISGVQGYNEEFYEQYAHLLEIDRLNIHDISSKIIHTKKLKLKDLRLYGDSDYSADEFWRRLNRCHPELKSLVLSYSSKGAPIPIHDYTKVTQLDLTHSFGDASEENLGSILKYFPSIKYIYLSGSITKECFFGHQDVKLENLNEAKIFLEEECKLTCAECIEAFTKCLYNVEEFNIDAVTVTLLQSISKNMKKLKKLSFSMTPDRTIFKDWPEMPSLEHLVFRYGLDSISIKDIQIIYKMCPKLESLDFEDSCSIINQ